MTGAGGADKRAAMAPLDSLSFWLGPALALVVSLGWAALFAGLKKPGLAALALPVGFAAGCVATLGHVSASPRQLPERFPLLALGLAAASLPVALLPKGWLWAATALVSGLGGAWWMAGAPLWGADVGRAATLLAAFGVLFAALALEARERWAALGAAAFLAAGLVGAGALGPWSALGVALLLAAMPALLLAPGPAALVPLAVLLGALAAGPVVGRGAAGDWLALAAPLAALFVGQRFGRWGWVVGAVPAGLAFAV